jgi:hypothetical protein
MKNKIVVSISGGETSCYMAKIVKDNYLDCEIVYIFANTGQEREETLVFLNECDKQFGLGVVWVESVITPEKGVGTKHRVVSFETANRNGDVFESMIDKYGIPNSSYPHCTRELKLSPIYSYIKSIGWAKSDYKTAIGIRSDEIDRVNPKHKELGLWYPLADMQITKSHVKDFWSKKQFRLMLKEHQGNCSWCWKKSDRKHFTLISESPELYDFPLRMEAKHKGYTFFRKNRSTVQMIEEAKKPFKPFVETAIYPIQDALDFTFGCIESCEVY